MESNSVGVCEAQDLRSDSKISFEIPTLRVALRVRLAIKLLAQDDTPNIKSAHYVNLKYIYRLKVLERKGVWGKKTNAPNFTRKSGAFA